MRRLLFIPVALVAAVALVALATAGPVSATPTVAAQIPTPGPPGGLVASDTGIWSSGVAGDLSQIDPAANAVVTSTPFATLPWPAYGFGSLWLDGPLPAGGGDATTVTRLDPTTSAVQATISVGAGPSGIGVGFGSVWVSNHHAGTVSRIDPVTNHEIAVVPIEDPKIGGPQAIVATAGGVWVGVPNMHAVVRIDPATDTVAEVVRVNACPCTQLVLDRDGGIWFSSSSLLKNAVVHLRPATGEVTWLPINGPGRPWTPAYLNGSIWVPTDAGTLVQIDPHTDGILSSTPLGGDFHFTTAGFGSLWLSDEAGHRVWRVNAG